MDTGLCVFGSCIGVSTAYVLDSDKRQLISLMFKSLFGCLGLKVKLTTHDTNKSSLFSFLSQITTRQYLFR